MAMATMNVRKNMIGTLLAGGIRSANAHYANMLLAFYLATGQDAANIVEGSQGVTVAELMPSMLRLFLAEYGWTGTTGEFLDVVRLRIGAHAAGVRDLASAGDPLFTRLVAQGVADDLDTALAELNEFA